jgi:hypothetical protein
MSRHVMLSSVCAATRCLGTPRIFQSLNSVDCAQVIFMQVECSSSDEVGVNFFSYTASVCCVLSCAVASPLPSVGCRMSC